MPKNRKAFSALKNDFVQKLIDALANPGTNLNPLQLEALLAYPFSLLKRTLSDYVTAVAKEEMYRLEVAIIQMIEKLNEELEKRPYYYCDDEMEVLDINLKEILKPENVIFGKGEKLDFLEKLIHDLERSIKDIDAKKADFVKDFLGSSFSKLKERVIHELNAYQQTLLKEIEKLEKKILNEALEISKEEALLRSAGIPLVDKVEDLTLQQRQTVIPESNGKTAEEVTRSRIERLEKSKNYQNQKQEYHEEFNISEKQKEVANKFNLSEGDIEKIMHEHDEIHKNIHEEAKQARAQGDEQRAKEIESLLPKKLDECLVKHMKENVGMDFRHNDERMGLIVDHLKQGIEKIGIFNNQRKIHDNALQGAKAKQQELNNALKFIQKSPSGRSEPPALRNGR